MIDIIIFTFTQLRVFSTTSIKICNIMINLSPIERSAALNPPNNKCMQLVDFDQLCVINNVVYIIWIKLLFSK